MIGENELDLRMVVARLETAAVEVGLLDRDVARILRLPPGGWPMPLAEQWSPLAVGVERRLRELGDVCRLIVETFDADAASWLRRDSGAAGTTPLEFVATQPAGLSTLRRALLVGLRAGSE